MDAELQLALSAALPSSEDDARAKRAVDIILAKTREIFSDSKYEVKPFGWCPEPQITVFGSRLQGTNLEGADIDLRLTFEQFAVLDQAKMRSYLADIKEALATQPEEFNLKVSNFISTARVPLLKLIYEQTLDVDLSLGCELGSRNNGQDNDHAIKRSLAELSVVRRDTLLFLKLWARRRRLLGIFEGLLSSMALIVMTLHYFQSALASDTGATSSSNTESLAGLLCGFFEWVLTLRSGRWKVCCASQDGVAASLAKLSDKSSSVIFVAAPCDSNKNLVERISRQNWNLFINECRRAKKLIEGQEKELSECTMCSELLKERSTDEDGEKDAWDGNTEGQASDFVHIGGRKWHIPKTETNGCVAVVMGIGRKLRQSTHWNYSEIERGKLLCTASLGEWTASSSTPAESRKAAQRRAAFNLLPVIVSGISGKRPPRHKRKAEQAREGTPSTFKEVDDNIAIDGGGPLAEPDVRKKVRLEEGTDQATIHSKVQASGAGDREGETASEPEA